MYNIFLIIDNVVANLIYINEESIAAFRAQGMELLDLPYLTIGDYRENNVWYRDIGGVKTALPLPEPEQENLAEIIDILTGEGE